MSERGAKSTAEASPRWDGNQSDGASVIVGRGFADIEQTKRRLGDATPVMAQFLEMKLAHPDHLLFFRMGDFYEMFFEDAVIAAEALGIALTKRGKSGDEDIAMCGVPHHQAERYLHDLIAQGFRVAVAEQMEDPATAKKRGYKAVVKREVTRLVTPGTIVESELLDGSTHNYLAAFAEHKAKGEAGGGALAWADISTGAFRVTSCSRSELSTLLARLRPAELITKTPIEMEISTITREAGAAISELAASGFDPVRAESRAAAVFDSATLDAFGQFEPAERSAIGALIDYIELTQRGRLPILQRPVRERSDDALRIDASTRRNLELTIGPNGSREGSLLAAIDHTVTSVGARLLERRLASPLTDIEAIRALHDELGFLLANPAIRENVRTQLRQTPDIERALSRLGLGRGGPRDLASLRDGLQSARALAEILDAENLPSLLIERESSLRGHDVLISALNRGIVEEPPLRLADGGAIAAGYDPELDTVRALRDDTRQVIAEMQSQYQELTGISALKVKHNNVLGYFVETPATHQKRMMSAPLDTTFMHRQTTANAVRFTTVELAELEGKIARAADQTAELEKAAFEALTKKALERSGPIARAAAALAAVDVAAGLAELAEIERWTRPELYEDRRFQVIEGRHPVVEASLRQELRRGGDNHQFVPNDCDLSADQNREANEASSEEGPKPIWLVTGPNMAGKSTFLRQNALIVILTQMGAYVPAARAEIGIVDQLFSRVGAADDLARGRSTFMVEMVETAAILNQAGPRALVILDEIGRGTATYDGLSIAWATLEHLHDVNQCRALFATHYHELTALTSALPGLKNATIAVKEWKGEVIFLRQVIPGAADRSYGVQVARLAGLPKSVVGRASEVLKSLETGSESSAARARRLIEELPLFAAAAAASAEAEPDQEKASELEVQLRELEPDLMTPRDALEALYKLKALLDQD